MSFHRYPAYKPSGVEWLGDVPEHWGVGQSRRLFALRNERARDDDKQLTASQEHGVIYQEDFIRIEGRRVVEVIKGADILKHVEPNDFVISMRSFQGGIEWCNLRGCISSAYVMLVPCERIHGPFFAYALKSRSYIQALQTTSNLVRDGQALRYENFTKVDLPLVPLDEQTAIAAFLDRETGKIDALVAEQRRLMELLKEKRQAVISHAVTRGLNPKAKLKPSGIKWLGEVPAHWQVVALKHLVSRPIIDGPHETPIKRDEGIPFVSAESVSQGSINFDKIWGYISPEDHAEYSKRYKPKRGDILLVKLGATTGTPAIVDTDLEFNVWVPLAAIRLKGEIEPRFILHVLRSNQLKVAYEFNWTYGTQQTLGLRTISNLQIPLPPESERKAIVEYLDSILPEFEALTAEAQRAIDLLQERRTALISAAVTGQIECR